MFVLKSLLNFFIFQFCFGVLLFTVIKQKNGHRGVKPISQIHFKRTENLQVSTTAKSFSSAPVHLSKHFLFVNTSRPQIVLNHDLQLFVSYISMVTTSRETSYDLTKLHQSIQKRMVSDLLIWAAMGLNSACLNSSSIQAQGPSHEHLKLPYWD